MAPRCSPTPRLDGEWVGRAAAVRHFGGGSRKVRAPQGRVVANSHPGQPAGSVPQRTDRLPLRRAVRVKRWCKRPPVRRATGAARQTPPGARSDRMRPRAARPSIRVDRTRRPATVVADGWSPPPLDSSRGGTEPGLQADPLPRLRRVEQDEAGPMIGFTRGRAARRRLRPVRQAVRPGRGPTARTAARASPAPR